jgi:hypothetical protein
MAGRVGRGHTLMNHDNATPSRHTPEPLSAKALSGKLSHAGLRAASRVLAGVWLKVQPTIQVERPRLQYLPPEPQT